MSPLPDKAVRLHRVDRTLYERGREKVLTWSVDIVRRQGPHIMAYSRANHEMQIHIFSQ